MSTQRPTLWSGLRRSLRTIRAILRREFIDVLRDPRSLGLTLLWPISMLVMYGYGIRYDVDNVPITILDYSATPESRDLTEQMLRSKYFTAVRFARDDHDVEHDLMNDAVKAAIVIPRDFSDHHSTRPVSDTHTSRMHTMSIRSRQGLPADFPLCRSVITPAQPLAS